MAWLSLSIETDCRHAEALADALLENGALSVSIEDADAGTPDEKPQFGEPGSLARPGWERSRVIALLDPGSDARRLVALCAARSGLDDVPAFSQEELPEQDWVRLTQSQFPPIRVAERLWIVPSWHLAPDPEATVLVLDPGMAFGTGSHPTTRLCLEWLERKVRPAVSVLDYGCGSGILAIAAAKLGAGDVLGVDIDEQAVLASRQNAERNRVEVSFQDSARALNGQFDLVVANILAKPLMVLAPAIGGHVRSGGCLALSGILLEQADEVIAAYAPCLPLAIAATLDGWVCLAGRRP
ncbi:50S ribosomal protein L11 methyltransferase [Accumulibacter sp.]|uniref:50S ribosomal protein L11 methyltransferase n=1 Tax=Accumulibacter sp. TaxID=2053492 RepID=UPI0026352828|nr:50S ribosomal protein L11 methyltransferase [Accumulibacter sp.]